MTMHATSYQHPAFAPTEYKRHEPENTLLYQLVNEHYPCFRDLMEERGTPLPDYVQLEFEEYLKCGLLEHGFLRVRCEYCTHERLVAFSCKKRGLCPSCGTRRMVDSAAHLVDEVLPEQPIRQWVLSIPMPMRLLLASYPHLLTKVLSIITRALGSFLIKKAGFTLKQAQTGAVTLIQRFGSALNLNIHFHMLFLDGVYYTDDIGITHFKRTARPSVEELQKLTHTISFRIGRFLERNGLLEREVENSYFTLDFDDNPLADIQGHSVTYRIAVGKNKGKKVFSLQTLPPSLDDNQNPNVGNVSGFSLHAGVSAEAYERDKIERLCRYITRPAISEKRLELTEHGQVRYELKTPYRNGTTHVFFDPADFMARLAALIPRPRMNLTRFCGVFAPNAKLRKLVVPGKRNKPIEPNTQTCLEFDEPADKRQKMRWMQRLKRVFQIDLNQCERCKKWGGVKVLNAVEDPDLITAFLKDYQPNKLEQLELLPRKQGPPQLALF
jgi:ribosomal protein S27E